MPKVGNIKKMVVNRSETIIYGYDSEYRLLSANSSINSRDFSYTYDAVGNRKTKTHNGVTHHYIYSAKGNRLDKVRSGSVTGPVVYSFEYDANGSMTGKFDGAGKKLVHVDYDQRRLAKVMGVNNQTSGLSFDYDANAYRIQKQSAAGTKKYLLEGEHLESVYGADNEVLATYLRGAVIDEVINGFERNSAGVMENRTFHHDQVNSVVALSDHNGTKTQSVVYGPFGESITSTGSNLNAMKYTGREQDAETGLYYYRARYYDPEIGRFISEDPIGFNGGINFYAYANNTPTMLRDPTGFYAGVDDLAFTGGGALIGLVAQGVMDLFVNREISPWQDYAAAAIGGAATGETLLYTGPVIAGASGAATTNLVKQGLYNVTDKAQGFDPISFIADTTVGAVTGLIPGFKLPGINQGRGSHLQVYNQIVTKFENGTISNISTETALKMFSGRAFETALPQGAVIGGLGGAGIAWGRDALNFDHSQDYFDFNLDLDLDYPNLENYADINLNPSWAGSYGGFVLYPRKINSNFAAQVYRK